MSTGAWDRPVTYETTKVGLYRTITTTADAAHVLLTDWPIKEGEALARARETCLAVLEGRKPADAARKAFLAAAKEAGVFIRP